MQKDSFDVLMIGTGQGGAQVAITLRRIGFNGSIALIGEESELPYERPPLSKEYLAGEKPFDRLLIRPAQFWAEKGFTLHLGRRVETVDPAAHRVTLDDGVRIRYGRLVWAGGGVPRRLTCPGGDLAGVHTVRTRTDIDRILAEVPAAQRIVVIGGGYIGLEAAAVLSRIGKQVVVLEALDRLLARVVGVPLSRFYEAEHRAHGVDIHLSVRVQSIEGSGGKMTCVRLAAGEILPADMVIAGIGIIPAVGPVTSAGASGGNGVEVDEFCRTGLPDVYAIGDCTAHVNAFGGGARVRLESVQNAVDPGALRCPRHYRQAAGLPVHSRVLVEPVRPAIANDRVGHRIRCRGRSWGPKDAQLFGDLLARRPSDRPRLRQCHQGLHPG